MSFTDMVIVILDGDCSVEAKLFGVAGTIENVF